MTEGSSPVRLLEDRVAIYSVLHSQLIFTKICYEEGKITMYKNKMSIRAYSNRGKQFDLNIGPGPKCCLVFEEMAYSAKQQLTLLPEIISSFPTLNEVYLSFMDPNGEIVAFDLIEDLYKSQKECLLYRLYFQVGQERRELKLENIRWFTDKLDMEEVECDTEINEYTPSEIQMFGARHIATLDSLVWPNHCIKGSNPQTEVFSPWEDDAHRRVPIVDKGHLNWVKIAEEGNMGHSCDESGDQILTAKDVVPFANFGTRRKITSETEWQDHIRSRDQGRGKL